MAGKEVKKQTKKVGKRRLKRYMRKTLGALFLASAIAVAAIPTENLQAAATGANDSDWGTLEKNMGKDASGIPEVSKSERIYTTGDGTYQFAYVAPQGSGNKVAVILGYDKSGSLPGGMLTIPDTVDAYSLRSDNLGTGEGYCAISKSGKFLYYQVMEDEPVLASTVSGGNADQNGYLLDEAGKVVTKEVPHYYPCDWDDRENWMSEGDKERPLEDFYYYEDNDREGEPKPTKTADEQWIKAISVQYIGNQYLEDDGKGGWKVAGTVDYSSKDNAVFANAGNIVNLSVGKDVSGVGDYAFYGCTNLKGITLNNGLNTIGVGAFAECANMIQANVDVHSMVKVIGDYAFYHCRALTSFAVPNQVSSIGNSAFEGCEALTTFTMGAKDAEGNEENGLLNSLGARVFKNCTSLQSLSFKNQFTEEIPLSTFQGCLSLAYIEVANNTINFTEDNMASYTFENFKADMPSTFYFKGPAPVGNIKAKTHETATTHQVPYSYYDKELRRDVYELTVDEGGQKVVYRVDDDDNLIYCGDDKGNDKVQAETVTLPESIGPNHITVIGTNTFKDNCNITRITIPASITTIEADAFKGCHKLEWVIFKDPNPDLTIGSRAFHTQEITSSCEHAEDVNANQSPKLNFMGPISYDSAPFQYAMNPTESIDNGSQPQTYITYYSGWPYQLAVQYNPEKDDNELIDYPTLTKLAAGKYSVKDYPYLTEEQAKNMQTSVQAYTEAVSKGGPNPLSQLNTDQAETIDAALNLVLPEGIEGIKQNLFVEKEADLTGEEKTDYDKTITAAGILNIDEGAFKGHKNLTGITLQNVTETIGKYAFEDCKKLELVSLPGTVRELGIRPFKGCEKLSSVDFNGGPYFTCNNGIIYEISSGVKDKLVEVLEGRISPLVTAEDTAGITALYPEAFADTDVLTVDLSNSTIKEVPENAFAGTTSLATVTLPWTMDGGKISDGAFKDSSVQVLTIPGNFINMTEKAFEGATHFDDKKLIIVCEPDGMADDFAKQHGLISQEKKPEKYFAVSFWYYDDAGVPRQIGETQQVLMGESAKEETPPAKPGYTFLEWRPNTWQAVMEDNLKVYAEYVKNDTVMYNVVFQDYNGKEISRQTVAAGGSAIIPQNPYREGYKFDGWMLSGGDGAYVTSLSNVQSDMTLIAQYHQLQEGENPDDTPFPSGSGSPSPGGNSGSPAPGGSSSPSPGANGPLYTLTVQNGSGSGSYAAGAQPVIIANDPARGQVFDYWSVSPEDEKIASTVLSASIITMPAKDVTVTAHYKAGSANSSSGGGGTGSGNNAVRPNRNVSELSNGTTVVIDKNGLSNTGVVSATVHGSSDNFTIKISESDAATAAALRALMAEYGSLDNIKYFPMDISLYDSTGTTKITDTTGLTVDITLPIPDSLITYAGNNRVASVANDRLERLGARFTTIQGVSCVTFTAEHFSPYMIYVDTGDLSAGNVSDSTPKTGDFIHPKWFLSIGLACLSFVLFVQKDGIRKPKKVKVKAG